MNTKNDKRMNDDEVSSANLLGDGNIFLKSQNATLLGRRLHDTLKLYNVSLMRRFSLDIFSFKLDRLLKNFTKTLSVRAVAMNCSAEMDHSFTTEADSRFVFY